jgi:meso-butanediol dehydrogenase/(S,S)-butanediol dehydrogenase/diacetyl reductase
MVVVEADVADERAVKGYVAATVAKFGRIDYFANHAGIESRDGLIEDQPVEHLDEAYAVNVRGVFLGLHHVLPVMKAQGRGSIVSTVSSSGVRASPGRSPYTMSKHTVIGLTRSAAVEAAGSGVRVNSVLPGPTDTAMLERTLVRQGRGGPRRILRHELHVFRRRWSHSAMISVRAVSRCSRPVWR